MSRSEWSCANPACRDPATGRRAVLGMVRKSGTLTVLLQADSWCDLRGRVVHIVCHVCGEARPYHDGVVHFVRGADSLGAGHPGPPLVPIPEGTGPAPRRSAPAAVA